MWVVAVGVHWSSRSRRGCAILCAVSYRRGRHWWSNEHPTCDACGKQALDEGALSYRLGWLQITGPIGPLHYCPDHAQPYVAAIEAVRGYWVGERG